MTDNELKQAIICCIRSETVADCKKMQCPALVTQECIFLSRAIDDREDTFYCEILRDALDLINRQQAEIERLKDEASKVRRKALLEASSKFAGHSDYHGDTILCKLICMAEGKEVEIAKPLDKSEIKSESVKEFVKEHKEIMRSFLDDDNEFLMKWCEYEVNTDNLVKEMVGDTE